MYELGQPTPPALTQGVSPRSAADTFERLSLSVWKLVTTRERKKRKKRKSLSSLRPAMSDAHSLHR